MKMDVEGFCEDCEKLRKLAESNEVILHRYAKTGISEKEIDQKRQDARKTYGRAILLFLQKAIKRGDEDRTLHIERSPVEAEGGPKMVVSYRNEDSTAGAEIFSVVYRNVSGRVYALSAMGPADTLSSRILLAVDTGSGVFSPSTIRSIADYVNKELSKIGPQTPAAEAKAVGAAPQCGCGEG